MEKLSIWTIYDHPRDYPVGAFVARRWEVTAAGESFPTADLLVADNLDELRRVLCFDRGLYRIPRSPGDDPAIVESWI